MSDCAIFFASPLFSRTRSLSWKASELAKVKKLTATPLQKPIHNDSTAITQQTGIKHDEKTQQFPSWRSDMLITRVRENYVIFLLVFFFQNNFQDFFSASQANFTSSSDSYVNISDQTFLMRHNLSLLEAISCECRTFILFQMDEKYCSRQASCWFSCLTNWLVNNSVSPACTWLWIFHPLTQTWMKFQAQKWPKKNIFFPQNNSPRGKTFRFHHRTGANDELTSLVVSFFENIREFIII